MFTCRRVAVFVILALAFSILPAPSGAGGPVALAADRAETPKFKTPELRRDMVWLQGQLSKGRAVDAD